MKNFNVEWDGKGNSVRKTTRLFVIIIIIIITLPGRLVVEHGICIKHLIFRCDEYLVVYLFEGIIFNTKYCFVVSVLFSFWKKIVYKLYYILHIVFFPIFDDE